MAPQNSVIGGRAAADEGSEEALYCWVSQFLVRELGALVQQGSDAGQQGLLISLICCPHLPQWHNFEEALSFRVSFLPSAPRDLPSEWSGQLNKPLNPTLHSSTPFNSAPLRSTTAQCCNLRQILSWTVLAEQKSSCIRYKQVRPSVSTEVKLQWTCLNLSKLESSVETRKSGTCIWKCLKSADVTLDLNLQISVFPFTLTPPAMAKLCKSVEKERSCWILFCCRL